MLRILLIVFVAMLSAAMYGGENYYYHYDARVDVTENKTEWSFIPGISFSTVQEKNISVTPFLKKEGRLFFRNLTSSDISYLQARGKLYPAITRPGQQGQLFLSGDIFIKLPDGIKESEVEKLLTENKLEKKKYLSTVGWYVVRVSENPVTVSRRLKEEKRVIYAEPSFFFPITLYSYRPNDTYFSNQWHLENTIGTAGGLSGNDSAHVAEAWELLRDAGESVGTGVRLSIIDDGFDFDHEDFVGKFSDPQNFGADTDKEMYDSKNDAHGTCCSGVAAANYDNGKGVAGACPECTIVPVRMSFQGTSLDQIAYEVFDYAYNREVDIISCSWGPSNGVYQMGAVVAELLDDIGQDMRNGKGAVILFASGNENVSIEANDFATNKNVFAIGATNAAGNRTSYSNFGPSLDFMAPSCDMKAGGWGAQDTVDGIWTTDNTSGGYNPGQMTADAAGKYAGQFGGTSSATPLAAGIIGLVLAANPDLTREEIYTLLKETADKTGVNPGEMPYNIEGFSDHYGWGRINACKAVKRALKMAQKNVSSDACGETIEEWPDDEEILDTEEITDHEAAEDKDLLPDVKADADSKPDSDTVLTPMGTEGCGCSLI